MAFISVVKLPNNTTYNIKDSNAIPASQKGAASGVVPLNASSKIDSIYLPSYVDDVIEGYYYNSKFYKESTHTTEISGETGKIYVDLATNKSYRYSGSAFIELSSGGSVISITRSLTSGTKSATITIDGTSYDLYSTNNTTYSAGTGISLSGTTFSVKLGYTTSGNNRAVQADSNGNLYVVQKDDNTWTALVGATSSANGSVGYINAVPPKDGYNTKFFRADGTWAVPNYPDVSGKIDTAGTGLSKSGTTLNHSNSVSAQSTQAVYPIKIDAQGHISGYGSAVTTTLATDSGTSAITLEHGGKYKLTAAGASVIFTMPSMSGSDTKVTQGAAITTSGAYPLILGYSTATTAVTNTVNKTSTLTYNPSTQALVAGKSVAIQSWKLDSTVTSGHLTLAYVS